MWQWALEQSLWMCKESVLAMSDAQTGAPQQSQLSMPGCVFWGVGVLVIKLIPKMTVKNRKRLPPCLFAFVGSDLLHICSTKASLVF